MPPSKVARRRAFLGGCTACTLFGGLLHNPAATADEHAKAEFVLPGRFTRPDISSEEGGLWALMDREETKLRSSAFVIDNTGLKNYLTSVLERIADAHSPDLRVYAVRSPLTNATIAPNGMMQIWSGLLLRLENEAQLVAVMGHELGHYVNRDSLLRLQDAKSRTAAMALMLPLGLIGLAGQLAMLAGSFSYSQSQESQADLVGLNRMRKLGYRTSQAARVWEQLRSELTAGAGGDPALKSVLFASHPGIEERAQMLREQSAADTTGDLASERYQLAVDPLLPELLADELKRAQYDETIALMSRLSLSRPLRADYLSTRGEAYRLRGSAEDLGRAIVDYEAACKLDSVPASAWRGLGLARKSVRHNAAATQAFSRYLQVAPQAPDAALIRSYLEELR